MGIRRVHGQGGRMGIRRVHGLEGGWGGWWLGVGSNGHQPKVPILEPHKTPILGPHTTHLISP